MLDNKAIQAALAGKGIYHGNLDGAVGPVTLAAIDTDLNAHAIPHDGWDGTRLLIAEEQLIIRDQGKDPGAIDGVLGDKTRAALLALQPVSSAPIVPTEKAGTYTPDLAPLLPKLWKTAKPEIAKGVLDSYETVFAKYHLDSRLRVLHFLTQISTESGGGRITRESMYYVNADRLRAVWPSRFGHMSDAQLAPYLRNEKALADLVYGSRMGNEKNGTNDDDGYNFRGAGLIQTTGLDSFEWLAHVTGLPLVEHPEMVADPRYALECAAAEFVYFSKCLPYADKDNLLAVSGLINVGRANVTANQVVGYADRKTWYARWEPVL